MLLPDFDVRSWRKINYRSADTVLAAEFLHGLYQRHDPFLNPVRFCRTLVVFRPWTATGYAPRREWGLLATRFGGRLLRRPETLGPELDRVLANPRTRSRELAARLDALDFDDASDCDLLDLALEMHHVPLGEIYEVNLVQVEHATDHALRHRIAELVDDPNASLDTVVARLLRCPDRTKAGEEERAFLRQVVALKRIGCDARSLGAEIEVALARYARLGAAYGAAEATSDGIRHRFEQYLRLDDDEIKARMVALEPESVESSALIEQLAADPIVSFITRYSRTTGLVRDRNKALLGTITRHRRRLLAAIATRRAVPLEALRLYLLEEVLRLVEMGIAVPHAEIRRRQESGLVLERRECANVGATRSVSMPFADAPSERGVLRGLTASAGRARGRVRVVHSAADLERMQMGDVLVAPGTDFDLAALLLLAGAVVTEEGGVLSHAAVVARERGIPCLIGVPGATEHLLDGELVEVDADQGLVRRTVAAPIHPLHRPEHGDVARTRALCHPEDRTKVGNKAATLIALGDMGECVVEEMRVLDVDACAVLLAELERGSDRGVYAVANELAECYAGRSLNLRSSSPHEDARWGSAAGIYTSAIAVDSTPDDIATALRTVLRSAVGRAAAAYRGHESSADLAILITRYRPFEHQGVSMSVSPWSVDDVLIEHAETTSGDSPARVERVHVPRNRSRRDVDVIAHVWRDLADVAVATLRIERRLGLPVEVEWGIADGHCTILQARPITTSATGASTTADVAELRRAT